MTDDKHDHVDDIDCMHAVEFLYAYLDGELTDKKSITQFEKHMQHCRSCFSRKQLEEELSRKIKDSSEEEVPDALKNRIKGIIDKF